MNLNNFTIKAQEAIAKAQQLAFNGSNPVIDTDHLLKALLAEEEAMAMLNLRTVERAVAGGEPGPEGNVAKLLNGEHAQRASDFGLAIAGPEGAFVDDGFSSVGTALIFVRCLTIAGGTSEIVRNQIAERILGLPRDPLID